MTSPDRRAVAGQVQVAPERRLAGGFSQGASVQGNVVLKPAPKDPDYIERYPTRSCSLISAWSGRYLSRTGA
jgi:hypothetical protein